MRSHWFLAGAFAAFMLPTSARSAPASQPAPDAAQPERSSEPRPAPASEPASEPSSGRADEPDGTAPVQDEPDGTAKRELPFDARQSESAPKDDPQLERPQAKKLRLDEAIDLALARHPQIVAARERVKAAKARVGQAQASYYPQINGTLQYVRATEMGSTASFHSIPGMSRVGGAIRDGVETRHSFNNFLAAIAVQQVLYDFGRTQGAVAAQKARVKAAQMEEVLAQQTVTFGVVRAFYDVQAARAGVEVARDLLETARGVLELTASAKAAGMRAPSERARAEADVAAAEVRLIEAEAELELARNRVAFAVGAVGEAYEPAEQPLPMDEVPTEAECIAVALENRPELGALDFEREGLEQDLRRTKARRYPRLDALASINSRGQFLPAAGQDPYHRFNWNAGVVLSIPIFQGLLVKKQKEEIEAQLDTLGGGQEAVRQAVVLEVQQALARVHAADAAERASRKGVRAATEALETLQERYAGGLASLVELTDAQDTYLSARLRAVRAAYDRYLTRAALSLAMGTPIGKPERPR